jgi:thiamine biosynthesis lipoprotein ApbE
VIAAADWTAWTCRVRVAVTDPAALDEARELLSDLLADVDLAASRFRDDSELAALDRADGAWMWISPLFTELLAVALRAARLTDGDVDPTVGASLAGPAPAGGWRIRVEDVTGDPDAAPAGASTLVTIRDGGLATSSVRARRWQRDGLWLHHLIDPHTGMPPAPAWRTVSAAAGTCVDANVLSTAAVVRGDRVWPLLREARLPVRLVTPDGQVLTAGGWPEESAA